MAYGRLARGWAKAAHQAYLIIYDFIGVKSTKTVHARIMGEALRGDN
jgi:hypothetical protein